MLFKNTTGGNLRTLLTFSPFLRSHRMTSSKAGDATVVPWCPLRTMMASPFLLVTTPNDALCT